MRAFYRKTKDERGTNHAFYRDDQQQNYYFNYELTNHKLLGEPSQRLSDGSATFGEAMEVQAPDLTPTGFAKHVDRSIKSHLQPHFQALQRAISQAKADVQRRLDEFAAPRFPDNQPASVRVEQRQWARSLPLAQLMEQVQRDPQLAAAIVEGGQPMSKLPPDIFARLERDVMTHNISTVLSKQHNFLTAPSASDPVGGKVDEVAVKRAGERWVEAVEAERDLIDSTPALLSSIVSAVALIMDENRDQAFARLAQ